jgi:hypothetical protein
MLGGRFPFVRAGSGPRTLLVLPGLALDEPNPGGVVARLYARGFGHLAREHTLYVVHRAPGLPPGAGTRDIAVRETTAALPDAVLRVLPGGHGVPKHRARQMQQEVAAFLAERAMPDSAS